MFEIGEVVIGIYSGRIFEVTELDGGSGFSGKLIGFDKSNAKEPFNYDEDEKDIGMETDGLASDAFKRYRVDIEFSF
ncbi:MAG: hypothetical protein ACRCX2_13270 [Paraclostridium sp.]